jgi:hypothetical protein
MTNEVFSGVEPGTEITVPAHPDLGAPTTVYPYVDELGVPRFFVCRFETEEGEKTFRQGHPSANGTGWRWDLRGVTTLLYRFDELAAHLIAGKPGPVYICEGEKDADACRAQMKVEGIDGVATTSPMGAGKWRAHFTDALIGARLVRVVSDFDEPGRKHADAIAKELVGVVGELELLRPALDHPKADLTDHLDASLRLGELLELEGEQADQTPAPSPFTIEVRTTRELAAIPDPSGIDEVLGPLVVRRHRIVLGGHTGEGKTTFILAVARAVAVGGDFLGWTAQAGRVLVIDAEQGLRTIKRRIAEAGLDECDGVDYARVPDGLALDRNVEHIAAVEELLERREYALVIADPLYKLHAGDSNAEREAVDLMRRLDAWRELHGFALALPVHCRKPIPGEKFSIHDLFGSSAYVRGAEVVLGLRRVSDGYAHLHFLKDRDGDLPIGEKWGLLFDRKHGFRRDPRDTEERDPVADVVAWLAEHEPSTVPEIARGVGMADKTVRDLLRSDPARFALKRASADRHPNANAWGLIEGTRPGAETRADDTGQVSLPYDSSGVLEGPLRAPVPGTSSGGHSSRPRAETFDEDELERLADLARELETDDAGAVGGGEGG